MRPELDDFNSCVHGIIPTGTVCSECEREEWAETCDTCGVGNADKLSRDGYACTNKDCIEDTGGMVWYVDGDDKIQFTPAENQVVTPGLLRNYLGGE